MKIPRLESLGQVLEEVCKSDMGCRWGVAPELGVEVMPERWVQALDLRKRGLTQKGSRQDELPIFANHSSSSLLLYLF